MSKIAVNEITDEVGTGAPAFPNGMSVTGAALTDPQITGGIFLGGTGSANQLDDYEEGTWTPVLTIGGSSAGIIHDFQKGTYRKIGNLVYIQIGVELSSKGSESGNVAISGFPFAVGDGGPFSECATSAIFAKNTTGNPLFGIVRAATFINIRKDSDQNEINESNITDNARFIFSLTYYVDS